LFFYSHFDDVAKKILSKYLFSIFEIFKYRAPNPISIACFIKDLGAAALNRKKKPLKKHYSILSPFFFSLTHTISRQKNFKQSCGDGVLLLLLCKIMNTYIHINK